VSYNPPPASADSTTHERDLGAELHTGYDFSLGSLTVGPRASVTFAHSDLDPYTESGATPMTLAVNEQTRTSLRSQLGFQVASAIKMAKGVLVPQLNADWLHEYRDPQQMLSAHFAEDLRPDPVELHFLNNPPDRDWFVIRVAAVVVLPRGFSGFAEIARTAGGLYVQRVQATLGIRMEL
jgi:outer membrane autotransporter protein